MEEVGVVLEVKPGGTAVVSMIKAGGCEGCSASGTCKAVSGDRVLEAANKIGAKAGQHVLVRIESGAFLKASFLVYMVPIIFLFVGAVIGGNYGPLVSKGISVDSWQAIGGVILLAASVVLIRLYDRSIKKGRLLKPEVVKVIDAGHEHEVA